MGLGIEARYEQSKHYWSKHLQYTKAFQVSSLAQRGESLAVLGAGRLFDFDLATLSKKFKTIALYDIDPSCYPTWYLARVKSAKDCKIDFCQCDLSCGVLRWSEVLQETLAQAEDVSADTVCYAISSCQIETALNLNNYSQIISLNLLSQIPIFWRDRVHSIIAKYGFATNQTGQVENQQIEAALQATLKLLTNHHLELLNQSKAKDLVLFFDQYFYYYEKNTAQWQVELALPIQNENTNLVEELCAKLSNYNLRNKDSWLWHISPQGIESQKFGTLHQVVALHFDCV